MQLKVSEVVEGHVTKMEKMKKEHDFELLEVIDRKNAEIKHLKKLIQVIMSMMTAYILMLYWCVIYNKTEKCVGISDCPKNSSQTVAAWNLHKSFSMIFLGLCYFSTLKFSNSHLFLSRINGFKLESYWKQATFVLSHGLKGFASRDGSTGSIPVTGATS